MGNQAKRVALKNITEIFSLDIMLVQEMMVKGVSIYEALKIVIKVWKFMAIDLVGTSGGEFTRWND